MHVVDDNRRTLLILGHRVKVNFGTASNLVGTIDCSFCPITFKLHIQVVDDERRNPIDFGSRSQWSR